MSITSFNGPLPTAFSSKSRCSDLTSRTIVGFDLAPSCLPKSFNTASPPIYSPGTQCPRGYTVQDSCIRSNGHTSTMTCCPRRGGLTLSCVADDKTLKDAFENMLCTWSAGDSQTVLLVTGKSTTEAVTMTAKDGINAYGIRMVHQPSDLSKTTDIPSETSSSDSGGSGGGGLSTGAIAAIGVVIPLVVIALGIGAFFLWRRKKKQSYGAVENHELAAGADTNKDKYRYAGATDQPGDGTQPASELYGSGSMGYRQPEIMSPQELPTQTHLSELPASAPPPASTSPGLNPNSRSLSPNTGYSSPPPGGSQAGVSSQTSPAMGHSSPHT